MQIPTVTASISHQMSRGRALAVDGCQFKYSGLEGMDLVEPGIVLEESRDRAPVAQGGRECKCPLKGRTHPVTRYT